MHGRQWGMVIGRAAVGKFRKKIIDFHMIRLPLYGRRVRCCLEECGKIQARDGYPEYGTDNGSFYYAIKSDVRVHLSLCARAPPFSGF